MPVTYQQADDEVLALVAEVIESTFPKLKELGVRVDVLMAHAARDKDGEPKGHAVKLHGAPALAVVSIVSLKDRVSGLGDARIVIDADKFAEMTDARKRSLVDHELAHLLPQYDDEGGPKTDDACRPVLKMRPHDFEIGLFFDVIERHKADSHEAIAYMDLNRRMSQTTFPWG